MSWLSNHGGLPPAVALLGGAALLVVVLWVSWRKPTWVFLIALASLAIRPQLLWGGPEIGWQWGLHQSLIAFALVMNGLRYGARTTINWPVLALVATLGLSLAAGDLYPKLTLPLMLESLAILALPFAFTQVVLAPGSRRAYALVIALTPLLSVGLGGIFELLNVHPLFGVYGGEHRLDGATGNAGVFAMLAFVGFAVAVHESTRPGRPYAAYLAAVNLALVILSGTRMAIAASVVLLSVYATISVTLRELARRHKRRALICGGVVASGLAFYLPTLWERLFDNANFTSGREGLWQFYLKEFQLSPWFGRGLGAGFIAGADWFPYELPLPHDEYLHLLVIGGVVGFVLIAGAIVLWYRHLLRITSPNDREFLLALAPALAAYALTDNVLIYSSALALYAYLSIALTSPSPFGLGLLEAEGWSAERAYPQPS